MAKKTVLGRHTTVKGACGVGVTHDWEYNDSDWIYGVPVESKNPGGAGWLMAGFVVGDKVCDIAKKQLTKKFNVVYESPVRLNKNSDNEFYFMVFDTLDSDIKQTFQYC